MKRVLCTAAAVVGFVGFAAPAASATTYQPPGPTVIYRVGDDNVFVGAALGNQPIGGAGADVSEHEVCAGISYQIPFCLSDWVDPSISVSLP